MTYKYLSDIELEFDGVTFGQDVYIINNGSFILIEWISHKQRTFVTEVWHCWGDKK